MVCCAFRHLVAVLVRTCLLAHQVGQADARWLVHGVGTHVLMGLDTHSRETMVVLCKFLLEALHTWTYTTNWQCYPPMGPRLYTPLSFSPG